MSNYQTFIINKDCTIKNGSVDTWKSGMHIVFNKSLIIEKGGTLEIIANSDWWKKTEKFCILEVLGTLHLCGSIIAKKWFLPDDIVEKGSFVIIEQFKGVLLKHTYEFLKCGKGGAGGNGISHGGLGAQGTLLNGGGGGGGAGWKDYNNTPGNTAIDIDGAVGGEGGLNGADKEKWTGGKGGQGAKVDNIGVGGLVLIYCHGDLIIDDEVDSNNKCGIIDVSGDNGNAGGDGQSVVGARGSGGGGGGTAGMPGGCAVVNTMGITKNNFKIINNRGLKGAGGNPGKADLGGVYLGSSGDPGDDN